MSIARMTDHSPDQENPDAAHFERLPGHGGWLTPKEVQEWTSLGEATVYREIQYGVFRPISLRVGRQWRVSASGLEQLFGDK